MSLDLEKFLYEKHNIKWHSFKTYFESNTGLKIKKIHKTYNGVVSIGSYSYDDENTTFIEFETDDGIKILGHFHDISRYDELTRPVATFSLITI